MSEYICFALKVFDIRNLWSDDIICCTNAKQFTSKLKSTDLSHFLKGHARQEEKTCIGLLLPVKHLHVLCVLLLCIIN